jgi:hypothetical protein
MEPMSLVGTLGKPAASLAAQHLLGIEDEKTRLLKDLDVKIDALLESSYRAGLIQLEHAADARDSAERSRYLNSAEGLFIQAVATLEKVDPFQAAWAAVYLAGISRLRRSNDQAARWVDRACIFAEEALQRHCVAFNDKIATRVGKISLTPALKLRGSRSLAAKAAAGGAGVGAGVGASAGVAGVGAVVYFPVFLGGIGAALGAAYGIDGYRRWKFRKLKEQLELICGFTNEVFALRSNMAGRECGQWVVISPPEKRAAELSRPLSIECRMA